MNVVKKWIRNSHPQQLGLGVGGCNGRYNNRFNAWLHDVIHFKNTDMIDKLNELGKFLKDNKITIVRGSKDGKLCVSIESDSVLRANKHFVDYEFEEEINGDDIDNENYIEVE